MSGFGQGQFAQVFGAWYEVVDADEATLRLLNYPDGRVLRALCVLSDRVPDGEWLV